VKSEKAKKNFFLKLPSFWTALAVEAAPAAGKEGKDSALAESGVV